MKRFSELTTEQKRLAVNGQLVIMLEKIGQGARYPALHEKINLAFAEAARLKAPWFFSVLLMEEASERLREQALLDVQDAFFPEPGEVVFTL